MRRGATQETSGRRSVAEIMAEKQRVAKAAAAAATAHRKREQQEKERLQ